MNGDGSTLQTRRSDRLKNKKQLSSGLENVTNAQQAKSKAKGNSKSTPKSGTLPLLQGEQIASTAKQPPQISLVTSLPSITKQQTQAPQPSATTTSLYVKGKKLGTPSVDQSSKASLALPSAVSLNKKYTAADDKTLTKPQTVKEGFASSLAPVESRYWRAASNMTLRDYSTGYHEVIPTNVIIFLSKAQPYSGSEHILGISYNKFIKVYNKCIVDSETLRYILKAADGYRTDTAQTILTRYMGGVAAHAGSGISTKGQAEAHDLLRAGVFDLLLQKKNTKGLTEASIHAVLGAVTITSMAPGIIIREHLNTLNLKAGPETRDAWEERRNTAKRRLNAFYSTLSKDEQQFTSNFMDGFFEKMQEGLLKKNSLRVRGHGPTSPYRGAHENNIKGVDGGRYVQGPEIDYHYKTATNQPGYNDIHDVAPPSDLKLMGFYLTQPFRVDRRK